MGTGTISEVIDDTVANASDLNQYASAIKGDMVTRNTSGVATDLSGDLGTSSYRWLKAFIASGYWTMGDIKSHHSYNGAAPIDQGWFPCNGSIINEANYDAVHGAGSWDIYVVSSALDGRYAPNLLDKYLVGKNSTTQDGTGAISSVGVAGNSINLQHSHTVNSHNHKWYNYLGSGQGSLYNAAGAAQFTAVAGSTSGSIEKNFTTSSSLGESGYTDLQSPGTNNQLSTAQSIQPESIEATFYVRII